MARRRTPTVRRILDAAGARALDAINGVSGDASQCPPAATVPNPTFAPDVPGLIADHLHVASDADFRAALLDGRTVLRGQCHTVRLPATIDLHRAAPEQSAALAAASPAARKALRIYAARITAADPVP